MELLSHPVVALIVLLGVLVFGHELGHYLVGKWCGIAVEMFSIGFGPPIVRWRRGETEYRISWIPLGGFVKFYGSMRSEPVPDFAKGREFYRSSTGKRAATVAAGPIANLIIAAVAYTALGFSGISHPAPVIGDVRQSSPADQAGLQFQDRFVSIAGEQIDTWQDMERVVQRSANKPLEVVVERDGQLVELSLTPQEVESQDIAGRPIQIGQAGISRGFWAPVLSVTNQAATAYESGIRNGDKVLSFQGETYQGKISYYREFLARLADELEAGSESVELELASELTRLTGREPEVRQVTLRLPTVKVEGIETALGFSDSMLTLGNVKEPGVGVLQPGDRIVAWGRDEVTDFYQLSRLIMGNDSPVVPMSVQRDGVQLQLEVPLLAREVQTASGKEIIHTIPGAFLGDVVHPEPFIEQYSNPLAAVQYGITETMRNSAMIVGAIYQLVTGQLPLQALGGPILIAKVAGDSAKRGWQAFVMTLALISVNLAIINLFPIPVLDGGQLVMIGAEVLRRRPLSELAIENFQKIGFVMVLGLIILATYNDFSRYWTSILRSITGGGLP